MKRILFKAFFSSIMILGCFCPQQAMGMKLESSIKLEQNLAISLGDDKTNPVVIQFFPYWIQNNVKDDGASFMKFFTKNDPAYLINWCLETLEKEKQKNNQAKLDFSDNKESQKDTLHHALICDLSGILRGRFIYNSEDEKTNAELTQWVLKKLNINSEIGLDKNDKLSEFFKDLCSTRTIKIKDNSSQGVLVCTGYVTGAIDLFNKSLKEFWGNHTPNNKTKTIIPTKTMLEIPKNIQKPLNIQKKNDSSKIIITVIVVGACVLMVCTACLINTYINDFEKYKTTEGYKRYYQNTGVAPLREAFIAGRFEKDFEKLISDVMALFFQKSK